MLRRSLPIVALGATAWTLLSVGVLFAAGFELALGVRPRAWSPQNLQLASWYVAGVLVIVGCHEAGHWWACRRAGLETRGPFLVPMPLGWATLLHLPLPTTALGIGGAWLPLRRGQAVPSDVYWRIAATGLTAGLVATGAVLALGLAWSVPSEAPYLTAWRPRLWTLLTAGLAWHPLVSAAWVGWLLTGISLFPIWPMDGWRLLVGACDGGAARRWWTGCWSLCGLGCWV